MADNGADKWLWVDPRREAGYNATRFDEAAFLARAISLFQSKPHWSGQAPDTVQAHPDQIGRGLLPVARALGLRVKADPFVTPGTYRLGIGGGEDGRS